MIHSAGRIIALALQNFFRNFWLSVATLTVIIITLILVNVVVAVNHIKSVSLATVENQVDFSLDFKQSVTAADIEAIAGEMRGDARVAAVVVVTPDENLERFKRRHEEIGARILPVLDANPLGYTLKIRAASLDDYPALIDSIEHNESVADKLHSTNFIDYRVLTSRVASFSKNLNAIALALVAIFMAIATIILLNTIRLGIYSHREEIGIMKLVGATNWFIRAPFLFESLLFSLISITVLVGIIFGALQIIQTYLTTYTDAWLNVNLAGYYYEHFWQVFGVQFAAVTLISGVSTTLALRRYLKV